VPARTALHVGVRKSSIAHPPSMIINWQDVLTSIGTTFVSATVIVGAAAWIVKTLISNRLVRQAEEFRIHLQADVDAANERLKSTLQMKAIEHEVRFSKFHEKRAEVIQALESQACELEGEAQRYAANVGRGESGQDGAERYMRLRDKLRDFDAYRDAHRIYLSDEVDTLLRRFVPTVWQPITRIGAVGEFGNASQETLRQNSENLSQAIQATSENVPAVRNALIKEFREILSGK
jgi:hypothetical protein